MRIFVRLLSILFAFDANAQQYPLDHKRDYNWCFGYDAEAPYWGRTVINFNSTPPDTSFYLADYDIDFENAGMSDTAGNLIFYSNGNDIYGADHQIIAYGDSINCCNAYFHGNYGFGYPYIQGMMMLPAPGYPDRYYVIYKPAEENGPDVLSYELRYTMVEKNTATGAYEVTEKEQVIFTGLLSSAALTACRHGNGRDWWIIQRRHNTNIYRMFLVGPSGIALHHSQTVGDTPVQHYGQTVFTPDGSKYIMSGGHDYAFDSAYIGIFDFDRCTGLLSNQTSYAFQDTVFGIRGCAVSPNSRYLYFSLPLKLLQFDLQAPDWKSSETVVAEYDGFVDTSFNWFGGTPFQWMQLAPDGKIYITAGATTYLHTIDNPDEGGMACNVSQHSFRLASFNSFSIPNFPNYRLGPIDGSLCDTLGIDLVNNLSHQPVFDFDFSLHPNPGSDQFTCTYNPLLRQAVIEVYDAVGRLQLSVPARASSTVVYTKALPAGFYTVNLVSEGKPLAKTRWVKTQ